MMMMARAVACAVLLFAAVALLTRVGEAKASSRKGSSKRKQKVAQENLFSGVTPAGSTRWRQDSRATIVTKVDTSHLKFDRVPQYLCSVAVDSKTARVSGGGNFSLGESPAAKSLVNVTGMYSPVQATKAGFSVRLRYDPELVTDKNLSTIEASLRGWRIRWVALTSGHPLFDVAREHVEDLEDEDSIEVKHVSPSLAYVQALEMFIKEDPQFVEGLLGRDYEVVKSKRLKPKPKAERAKPKKAKQSKSSPENASGQAKKEDKEEGSGRGGADPTKGTAEKM